MAEVLRRTHSLVSVMRDTRNLIKKQVGPVSIVRGTATLVGGTVTVSSIPVSPGSTNVQLSRNTEGGTVGHLKCTTRTAGPTGSIVIASGSGTETSTVDYELTNVWPHLDVTERTITAANASDLATSITLVNELRKAYEFHRVDYGDGMAHLASDTTNAIAAPYATDLATAITLANELKTDYNAHRSQSGVHHVSDGGNAISSANASDQSSLNTLLNELKTDFNAHIAAAPTNAAPAIRLVDA